MRKITIFYDGSWYTFKWLKTLLWAKDVFLQYGYDIGFLNDDHFKHSYDKNDLIIKDFNNNEYDIVFLAFHDSHIGLCSLEDEVFQKTMISLRERSGSIVWLDTADSTGNIWIKAFPFVDKYLKKQICKDLKYYTTSHWGDRPYTEFFRDRGLVEDDNVGIISNSISENETRKMGVSWNVGLGDLFSDKDYCYNKQDSLKQLQTEPPETKRKYDVQFRGSYDYSFCGFQRNRCIDILKTMSVTHNDMSNKLDFDSYLNEIAESKTVISPFGFGEICSRDFESFLKGSLLVKPDMSHLNTFPYWYDERNTYLPVKWDLADFDEVIKGSLENDRARLEIARNAQERFLYYRNSEEGKKEFVEHIIQQIQEL